MDRFNKLKIFFISLTLVVSMSFIVFAETESKSETETEKKETATETEVKKKTRFIPYSAINFSLGATMFEANNSSPSMLFSTNLNTDIGAVIKLADKHTLFLLYELKYVGPGLKRTEGRDFTERTMDHIFFIQYQTNLTDKLLLKTRINFMNEFLRTGANELWGTGVYDFSRTGIYCELIKDKKLTGIIAYDNFNFPNYTNIYEELMMAQGAELTEGITSKGSQNYIQLGASYKLEGNFVSGKQTIQSYTSQKVLDVNGGFKDKLQCDYVTDLKYTRTQRLSKSILIKPSLSFRLKTSNQNYLHFEEIGISTSAFEGVEHYYDYSQTLLTIPFYLSLTKTKSIFAIFDYDMKQYSSRPARDKGNSLLDETQSNTLTLVTLGYSVKWNDVSKWILLYNFQQQTSNEKYLSYNYNGHYVGMNFSFSY